MLKSRICIPILFLFIASAVAAVADDMTIVSSVKLGMDKTVSTEKVYITEGKIRISQDKSDGIIDAAAGRLIMIDHAKKEYSESSFSEIAAQFDNMMPKNGKAREMMARMFSRLEVKEGKKSRTIAGYECTQYTLRIEGGEYEIWATPKLQAPQSYYESMEMLYAGFSSFPNPQSPIYAEMRKRKLTPLATSLTTMRIGTMELMSGVMGAMSAGLASGMGMPGVAPGVKGTPKTDTLSEATEVILGPIPASTFEAPADYTKKDFSFKAR